MKQQENRAEPQEKQIRFIDSHYNLKFYIPDVQMVVINILAHSVCCVSITRCRFAGAEWMKCG